ncbi:arylsulfate sulfotransferase [Pandoraea thiooxydans]|uniref:Aryl-sulfate sulfotransferase n=1 Tax=Pandoraea thiooxydans TaxID=445709 RepID=A0A0G3EL17_9BURK|nr:ribbon-helix-helix domain-containing protein [Pandoraea thiooxydans]AKJ67758.1 aryl-sulfate sulfotransferase [Pandoraea thiooxydans]APR94910.1 arylsulfate sulfotransferase [Pandoraea thiooxydans]
MCNVYVKADPMLYESRTRSLRVHGVITTVRLENLFWDVLHDIAERENLTTSQFVVKLYDELTTLRGEVTNFASFLRVCCLRYLASSERERTAAPEAKGQAAAPLRQIKSA